MSSNVTQSSLGGLPLEFQKKLIALLERLEGRIAFPYDDADGKRVGGPHGKRTISGNLTIGIGWNLEQNPLPDHIIDEMAVWMLERMRRELTNAHPWILKLDEARQIALLLMAYQMGVGGLLKFRKMLDAIKEGRWEEAEKEALDSGWGRRFTARARFTAYILRTGVIPSEDLI